MKLVIKKRLSERILSIKTVEKTVKNGSYAPLFLFLKTSLGVLVTFTGNILGTFSSQSRTPVIETVSKQYKIGYTVEATFPSSYSSLFYIQLSPGGFVGLPNGHRQPPRLVPETSK